MENTVNLKVENGSGELVIRTGTATKPVDILKVDIDGCIDSVRNYLTSRPDINQRYAHVVFNRDEMYIRLYENEMLPNGVTVTGCLVFSEEFKAFGINSGKNWVAREFAQFIKMNRTCFESKDVANKLSALFMDIKFKIDKVIETSGNNRGNVKNLKEQTIRECNIPETITLNMPVFKGSKKSTFVCEIYIDNNDLSISIVSPDAADIINSVCDEIIDTEISAIRDICSNLAIIEK